MIKFRTLNRQPCAFVFGVLKNYLRTFLVQLQTRTLLSAASSWNNSTWSTQKYITHYESTNTIQPNTYNPANYKQQDTLIPCTGADQLLKSCLLITVLSQDHCSSADIPLVWHCSSVHFGCLDLACAVANLFSRAWVSLLLANHAHSVVHLLRAHSMGLLPLLPCGAGLHLHQQHSGSHSAKREDIGVIQPSQNPAQHFYGIPWNTCHSFNPSTVR